MEDLAKWDLTDAEKEKFIDALTDELPVLRAQVGIAQDQLAHLLGISRQTYGSIERKTRKMSWNTYLSLIFFFDYNQATHQFIRNISAFPTELINRFNKCASESQINVGALAGLDLSDIGDKLDEQAMHTIRTVILVEYARCTGTPGDAVVRSFDGRVFTDMSKKDISVQESVKNIRRRRRKNT